MAESHLSSYFEAVSQRIQAGILSPPKGCVFLFPTTVVFTRTPTHYAFELFGSRRRCGSLKSKLSTPTSFSLVMEDFEYGGPTAYMFRPGHSEGPKLLTAFVNIAFTAQKTLDALDERFPGLISLFRTQMRFVPEITDCIKWFGGGNDLNFPLMIGNCLTANSLENIVRARYINLFVAIPAELDSQAVATALQDVLTAWEDLPGIQVVS